MPKLKTTLTAIQMLSYQHGCPVLLYLVLWGSGRNTGSLNMQLYYVLPSPLLCFFVSATFKTQRGTHTSSKLFLSHLTCTSQRHKLVSAKMFSMFSGKTSDVFTSYVAWGHEKATLNPIWPVRLKRISRNAIWIGFQTTYECSSKRICTNQISCSSLPFRLFKYDRISIGFGLTVWMRLKTTAIILILWFIISVETVVLLNIFWNLFSLIRLIKSKK